MGDLMGQHDRHVIGSRRLRLRADDDERRVHTDCGGIRAPIGRAYNGHVSGASRPHSTSW